MPGKEKTIKKEVYEYRIKRANKEKAEKLIKKWYYPKVILYEIEGETIGSNSKENALKEYWRRCELELVGKQFEVKIIG